MVTMITMVTIVTILVQGTVVTMITMVTIVIILVQVTVVTMIMVTIVTIGYKTLIWLPWVVLSYTGLYIFLTRCIFYITYKPCL